MAHSLILGGAKCGKTAFALTHALGLSQDKPYYCATCMMRDGEMAEKIAAHRLERGDNFHNVESGLDLVGTLNHIPSATIIIDDIAMWLNNVLYYQENIHDHCQNFLEFLEQTDHRIIMVSPEISLAPIAEHRETRQFVNHLGALNQQIAQKSQQVYLIVAGIPITIKS